MPFSSLSKLTMQLIIAGLLSAILIVALILNDPLQAITVAHAQITTGLE